jgi:hypothetical protein
VIGLEHHAVRLEFIKGIAGFLDRSIDIGQGREANKPKRAG